MSTLNASFASPLADATFAKMTMPAEGIVSRISGNLNVWTVLLTLLVLAVGYDQCE